jgi:hypothetical protein
MRAGASLPSAVAKAAVAAIIVGEFVERAAALRIAEHRPGEGGAPLLARRRQPPFGIARLQFVRHSLKHFGVFEQEGLGLPVGPAAARAGGGEQARPQKPAQYRECEDASSAQNRFLHGGQA